jgi:putative heme iron utilization protein
VSTSAPDHDVPGDAPSVPPPLADVPAVRRRTPAEEARTLVALTNAATLATLTADGDPWGSLVTFGALGSGAPVLCVSTLAEHGRNLERDARASLVVTETRLGEDPLATGRVTLAGRAVQPAGAARDEARAALLAGVPSASVYVDFGDFTLWVLDVERVRWVGGYGRMASASAGDYAAAAPDPVGASAGAAVEHLNVDHADALLGMARALGGYPDAESAACTGADRYGLDLVVETPRGRAPTRVGFAEPVEEPGGLRAATVELARRARG